VSSFDRVVSISLGALVSKARDGKDVNPEDSEVVGLGITDILGVAAVLATNEGSDVNSIDVKIGLAEGSATAISDGPKEGFELGTESACEDGSPVGATEIDGDEDPEGDTLGLEDGSNSSEREGFKEGSSLSTIYLDGALDTEGDTLSSAEGSLECTAEGSPLGAPDCDGAVDTVGSNETEGTLDHDGKLDLEGADVFDGASDSVG